MSDQIENEIRKIKDKLNELIKKFNNHEHYIISEDHTDLPDERVEELT